MNFFGHCVAACWQSRDPAFALGAMLPDFAAMCGTRVPGTANDRVAAGLAWHVATDRAFHGTFEFRQFECDLAKRLRVRGVSRGGALGAAHVGVELLLDGLLLDDRAAAHVYLQALAVAHPSQLAGAISWTNSEAPATFERLRAHLSVGLPVGYRDPTVVAHRVERTLARRPRLALSPGEVDVMAEELPAMQRRIEFTRPAWMTGLRRALG